MGALWLAATAPRLGAAAEPKTVPHVVVQRADGGTEALDAHKGRVLLVDFWASWCIPCRTAFPALDVLYQEYEPRGVDVVAVNLDERRRDADTFLMDRPHHMPVLFDPKGVSPAAFGLTGMPSSYLIDRAGTIRFTHQGYSGNVHEAYRRELEQLLAEH